MQNISRTLKVSSSAVAKTIKRYDEFAAVTSAAEDKFISYQPQKLQPKLMLHRVQVTDISTSTVRRRLHESGLYGRIAAKKALRNDTNKNKRLAWAKKHEQWTLDQWKSVLWSGQSKFEMFGCNCCVFVKHRVGEQMIAACVVPTMKHGGGGVMVLCW